MNMGIVQFLRDNKDRYTARQLKARLLDQGHAEAEIDAAVVLVFGRSPSDSPPPLAQAAGDRADAPASPPARPGFQAMTILIWILVIVFFLPIIKMLVRLLAGG